MFLTAILSTFQSFSQFFWQKRTCSAETTIEVLRICHPCGKGTSVTVPKSHSLICAIKALQLYLTLRKFSYGPLFLFKSGEFLTPQRFAKEIRNLLSKCGQEPTDYAIHSFRIGAATAAANANLPEWIIETMGRWTSDYYQRYIQKPTVAVSQFSTNLINESNRL